MLERRRLAVVRIKNAKREAKVTEVALQFRPSRDKKRILWVMTGKVRSRREKKLNDYTWDKDKALRCVKRHSTDVN